jgi:hypothetical protein
VASFIGDALPCVLNLIEACLKKETLAAACVAVFMLVSRT